MRKQYKKKLHSCPMCKPHKTNGANRWKPKDLYGLKNDIKNGVDEHDCRYDEDWEWDDYIKYKDEK